MIRTVVFVAFAAINVLVLGAAGLRHLARRERDTTLEADLSAKSQRLRQRIATQKLDDRLRARAAGIDSARAHPPRPQRAARSAELQLLRRPGSAA